MVVKGRSANQVKHDTIFSTTLCPYRQMEVLINGHVLVQALLKLTAVGFERMQLALVELES